MCVETRIRLDELQHPDPTREKFPALQKFPAYGRHLESYRKAVQSNGGGVLADDRACWEHRKARGTLIALCKWFPFAFQMIAKPLRWANRLINGVSRQDRRFTENRARCTVDDDRQV